jgi:hypothetical protein
MAPPPRDVKVCPGSNLLRRRTSIERFEKRQEGDVAAQTDTSHPQHGFGCEGIQISLTLSSSISADLKPTGRLQQWRLDGLTRRCKVPLGSANQRPQACLVRGNSACFMQRSKFNFIRTSCVFCVASSRCTSYSGPPPMACSAPSLPTASLPDCQIGVPLVPTYQDLPIARL